MKNIENIPENHIKSGSQKRQMSVYWIILLTLVVAFMVYYISMLTLGANRWIKYCNKEYGFNDLNSFDHRIITDSAFIAIQQQIAFNKARLNMAQTDSIGLSINLADSLICLEINGVAVHNVDISSYRVSKTIYGTDHYALSQMLATANIVTNSKATIPKEPIMIKKAPRDSIEAAKPDIVPDTSTAVPVFFIISLDKGLRLLIMQDEMRNGSQKRIKFLFLTKMRFNRFRETIMDLIRFRVPTFYPTIQLTIPGPEARILYRAIPENGRIALLIQ